MTLRLSAFVLFCLGSGSWAHAALPDPSFARAANGDSIPAPASRATYSITTAGQPIDVPDGMVFVPAGAFTMGAGPDAKSVTLPAYFIGKFEVTNVEYKAFLDATHARAFPRHWRNGQFPAGKANHPVLYVSLDDALAYCAWVSEQTGRHATIPSAAQWEKAARGPEGFLYPWGNSMDSSYDPSTGKLFTKFNYNAVVAAAWIRDHAQEQATYVHEKSTYKGQTTTVARISAYDENGRATAFSLSPSGAVSGWVNHSTYTGFIYTSAYRDIMETGGNTTPVGTFASGKSAYGCYDMAGNVFEWTATIITAANGAEKGKKVNDVRGGSWYANGSSARATGIGEGRAASGAYHSVGFRIVANPDNAR